MLFNILSTLHLHFTAFFKKVFITSWCCFHFKQPRCTHWVSRVTAQDKRGSKRLITSSVRRSLQCTTRLFIATGEMTSYEDQISWQMFISICSQWQKMFYTDVKGTDQQMGWCMRKKSLFSLREKERHKWVACEIHKRPSPHSTPARPSKVTCQVKQSPRRSSFSTSFTDSGKAHFHSNSNRGKWCSITVGPWMKISEIRKRMLKTQSSYNIGTSCQCGHIEDHKALYWFIPSVERALSSSQPPWVRWMEILLFWAAERSRSSAKFITTCNQNQ